MNDLFFIKREYLNDDYSKFFTVTISDDNTLLKITCEDPKGYKAVYDKIQKKASADYDPLSYLGVTVSKNELLNLEFTIQLDANMKLQSYTRTEVSDYGDGLKTDTKTTSTYSNVNRVDLDPKTIDELLKKDLQVGDVVKF